MRGLTSTILLIVVLAGLGAYIYFVDSKQPAGSLGPAGTMTEVKTKVFTVEADKIEEIRVTAEKETSLVKKVNGTWQMVEPAQGDADQTEASGLASSIAGVELNRVVEENATDLATYGLADPRFKVAFKAADGVAGELHVGEKTATQNDLYAVKAGDKRVFLVSSFQESSFNKKPFDLRDKRVLTVKREDIDSLDISGDANLQLARTGTEWNVRRPVDARGDYSAIEGLLTRIGSATMTKIVEQAPAGGSIAPDVLTKYGLDKPPLTVTVGAGGTKAALAIGKEEGGTSTPATSPAPWCLLLIRRSRPISKSRRTNTATRTCSNSAHSILRGSASRAGLTRTSSRRWALAPVRVTSGSGRPTVARLPTSIRRRWTTSCPR